MSAFPCVPAQLMPVLFSEMKLAVVPTGVLSSIPSKTAFVPVFVIVTEKVRFWPTTDMPLTV